jgi:methylenetetrahydrofolate reductase (NADPH)
MKVTEHIAAAEKHIVFFRNYTASKGKSIQELYDNIDPLMEFKLLDVPLESLFMSIKGMVC